MDSHARKKAIFRAKLKDHAQKQEKRIESPLVRLETFSLVNFDVLTDVC